MRTRDRKQDDDSKWPALARPLTGLAERASPTADAEFTPAAPPLDMTDWPLESDGKPSTWREFMPRPEPSSQAKTQLSSAQALRESGVIRSLPAATPVPDDVVGNSAERRHEERDDVTEASFVEPLQLILSLSPRQTFSEPGVEEPLTEAELWFVAEPSEAEALYLPDDDGLGPVAADDQLAALPKSAALGDVFPNLAAQSLDISALALNPFDPVTLPVTYFMGPEPGAVRVSYDLDRTPEAGPEIVSTQLMAADASGVEPNSAAPALEPHAGMQAASYRDVGPMMPPQLADTCVLEFPLPQPEGALGLATDFDAPLGAQQRPALLPGRFALGASAALILIGLIGSVCFRVGGVARGRGILRAPAGVQAIAPAISGTVQSIRVHSGDSVAPGDTILTLDPAGLPGEVAASLRELELARRRLSEFTEQRGVHERNLRIARSAAAAAARRLRSAAASPATATGSVVSELWQRALLPPPEPEAPADPILQQELTQARGQASLLERERQAQWTRLRVAVEQAEAHHAELETSLAQTSVRARAAGRVEGLQLNIGDRLAAGQAVASLVPSAQVARAVLFVPEAERAALQVGGRASLELKQLPAAVFGGVTAAITAIGARDATQEERAAALGADAAAMGREYRVELAVDQTPHNDRLLQQSTPDAAVSGEFELAPRPLIAVAFERVRRRLERSR